MDIERKFDFPAYLTQADKSSIAASLYNLSMVRPVLKKNCLHLQNNIILTWKSFEIYVVKMLSKEQQIAEKINQPYKFFNPIYVPILQA